MGCLRGYGIASRASSPPGIFVLDEVMRKVNIIRSSVGSGRSMCAACAIVSAATEM
jgi:hypothetical protein